MDPTVLLVFAGVALTVILVPGPDWVFVLAASARSRVIAPAVGGLMIGYAFVVTAVALGVGPLLEAAPLGLTVLTLAGAIYLIYLGIAILRGTRKDGDNSSGGDAMNIGDAANHGDALNGGDATAGTPSGRDRDGAARAPGPSAKPSREPALAAAAQVPSNGPTGSASLPTAGQPLPSPRPEAPAQPRPLSARTYMRRGAGVTALNPKALLFLLAILPQFAQPASPWPLPAQLATLGLVYMLIGTMFYLLLGYASDRLFVTRPGVGQVVSRVSGALMILAAAVLLVKQAVQSLGLLG
ncbi:hypothetical protein GCM10022261_08310 [Brevibacterium daeguense]|uniref:LysE type translocator n=1 Tax=Brevibacterium daeguense TaxID=909936 RepID=A0ABP8EH80_9MICO|nr:LysE family transporter [Brevibacterium daeguense]